MESLSFSSKSAIIVNISAFPTHTSQKLHLLFLLSRFKLTKLHFEILADYYIEQSILFPILKSGTAAKVKKSN